MQIEANLDILQKSEQMYQNDLRNKLGGLGHRNSKTMNLPEQLRLN